VTQDLHAQTLTQLSAGLERGDFSSLELTEALLGRIESHNQTLNAFITITTEQALEAAGRADAARAAGKAGALNGLPLVHKDIFCTRDVLTTCGSRMLENFISPYNATVVQRFADAGAVVLGKTNMDEFAMGSSNETSYFGPVRNPWNLECSPGGSSGGSAVAVAARLAPAATGTDTGGSIRQPAALTGTVGLKPTYGRVSRYGMIAFASSLDPDYVSGLSGSLEGLRVGIVRQHFDEGLDESCAAAVKESLAVLESQGAILTEVDLPNLDLSVPTYYVVAPAECSSNLSRFDGVRFGHRAEDPEDLFDLYCRSRGEGFGAEVKRRIMTGTYVLSAGYYDAYYLKAQRVRQLIADDFRKAFASVDVIAGPTAPTPAFKLGDKIDDPITMYLNDIYTIGANLAGLPGISTPCGLVDDLPVGLHLVGPHFGEETILKCAHQFEKQTEWHRVCPEGYK